MKKYFKGAITALSVLCLSNSASAALLGEAFFTNSIGWNHQFSSASYYLKYTIFNPDLVIFDGAVTEGDDGKVFRFDNNSGDFSSVVTWLTNGGAGTYIQHGLCIPTACAVVTTTDPFLNPAGFNTVPGSGVDFFGHSISYMEMAIREITFEPNSIGGTNVEIAGSFRTYGDEAVAVPEPAALLLVGVGLAGIAAARRLRRPRAQPSAH